VLFAQVEVNGSYWTDLFPGFLIVALGLAFCFVPISIAALAGIKPSEAGLASGLINTSQQIGGAFGIALLSTLAVGRTEDEVAQGTATPNALVDGFQIAFWVGAAIAAVGAVAALVFIRRRDLEAVPVPEAVPALDAAA
jgi:MFS family permease